ncbi:hypothetical protein AAFM48_22270 [Burkholderia pseudomallei]
MQIVQRRVRLPIEFVDLDPADGDVLRQLEARHDPVRTASTSVGLRC